MKLFSIITFVALITTPAVLADYDQMQMLCDVNQERANNGLPALGWSDELNTAAQWHSDDQAAMDSMTHDGSDGTNPGDRVQEAGYNWVTVAENVAYGYADQELCLQEWLQSPGHRANILGDTYTHFGSACGYDASGTPYYTQDFASDGNSYSFPLCPSGTPDDVTDDGTDDGTSDGTDDGTDDSGDGTDWTTYDGTDDGTDDGTTITWTTYSS